MKVFTKEEAQNVMNHILKTRNLPLSELVNKMLKEKVSSVGQIIGRKTEESIKNNVKIITDTISNQYSKLPDHDELKKIISAFIESLNIKRES